MSRDEKMRDLMRRLMAMAPEPPPYPEEMTMARHEADNRRPHPLLVVAATVAAVAALAVPLFMLAGDEPDAVASTTTAAPATSTNPVETSTTDRSETTTTTTGETTTSTSPVVEEWEGVVFLYQQPEASFLGNPALVPVDLSVGGSFDEGVDFSRALASVDELPEGLRNAIPRDVIVLDVVTDGDVITADMSTSFADGAGGLLEDTTMLNQLVFTLTYESFDARVLFTVGGEPVEAFGTEGIVLTEPVGRDDFLDQLHSIELTRPVTAGEGGAYLVEGIANVFEATLNVAVVDGAGDTVHEQVVTASCGTGCWGEFSTTIPAGVVTPGESSVQLFTYSAEDGSVVDLVTVPIPQDGVWRLTGS